MQGPLSDEFRRALAEVRVGKARRDALRDIVPRTEVPALTNFIGAIIQAEQLGVSISKVLQVQSEQLRIERRQRAEEMAAKAPIKMLFPLVGCIFPSLFIVILGPAIILIIKNLAGPGGPGGEARAIAAARGRRPRPGRAQPHARHRAGASLEVAESFGGRFMGLMGRPSLAAGAGLWLRPASSIHMLFMRFPIDAVFLGGPAADGGRAASWRCRRALRPWTGVVWWARGARRLPGAARSGRVDRVRRRRSGDRDRRWSERRHARARR